MLMLFSHHLFIPQKNMIFDDDWSFFLNNFLRKTAFKKIIMMIFYRFSICKVYSIFKCSWFCNDSFCRFHAVELFSACMSICNKSQSINWSCCMLTALGGHVCCKGFLAIKRHFFPIPLSCFVSVRVSGQHKARIKQNNQAMYFHGGKQIAVGKF